MEKIESKNADDIASMNMEAIAVPNDNKIESPATDDIARPNMEKHEYE